MMNTNGARAICVLMFFACFSMIDAGDREVLLDLYESTGGNNWIKSKNWGTDEPICSWHGITCSSNPDSNKENDAVFDSTHETDASYMGQASASKIIKINLSKNNLSGLLPESIGDLDHLQYLNLRENLLRGPIPSSIGKLPLTHLDLSRNQIQGTFPQGILSLSNLRNLTLAVNLLEGTLPSALSNLINLELLDVGSNKFYGAVPASYSQLTNLKVLSLKKNQFSSIDVLAVAAFGDRVFPDFPNLEILEIQHNNFSGKLPRGIFGHNNIKVIRVGHNRFSGRFPPVFPQVKEVDLSYNKLKGTLPQQIGNGKSLQILNIANNAFSGKFPEYFMRLKNLTKFNANNNKFEGPIAAFRELTSLKSVEIANNYLIGQLPSFLQKMDKCDLAGNRFACGETDSTIDKELYKKCNITCKNDKQQRH